MKIWYQSYSPMGFDPKWKTYEETLKRCIQESARPDTTVEVCGVSKLSPRMIDSDYIQYLHVAQVIEKGLEAEKKGYDAFIVGGTLDPGAVYIRELLDIPVAFIGESSFYTACYLAPRFSVIASSPLLLRRQTRLVESYGLAQRFVPGDCLQGMTLVEIIAQMGKNPAGVIDLVRKAAAKPIAAGAGALVPGFGAITSFLADQGIRDIDGVPIVDGVAVVIKTAEMLVDLHRMGIKRSKRGLDVSPATKEELMAARKLYGAE